MKQFSILVLIIILCQQTFSQSTSQAGGGGGFTAGYGNMDVTDFQAFLPGESRDLREDHLLLGGMGYGMAGRFVIGGSGMGMIGEQSNTDSLKVSLGGGMGTFNLGYLITNTNKVQFFPMIGIGGGGYGISISRNENISVEEVRENPGREINISKGSFLFDFSLNLHFIPVLTYDEQSNSDGGLMTGLQVGYLASIPSSEWAFAGGDISNGPDFGLNMFYIKMIIGGFGRERQL